MSTLDGEGKWFFSLVRKDGLFTKHPKEEIIYPRILVAYNLPDDIVRPENVKRVFRVFENPKRLFRFISKIDKSSRHFFEYIFGETKRHAFLDIDLKVDEDKIITRENIDSHATFLRHDIVNIFWELGIPLENLRWYSSNNERKRSYHLIVLGYYLNDCHHSKRLIKYIHQKIHSIYHKPVDIAVSKSLQAFRLLGSCKKGDERPKILEREWDFYGEKIIVEKKSEYEEFLESLCCKIDEGDQPFPEFELDEEEVNRRVSNVIDVSDTIDQEIFEHMNTEIIKLIGENFDEPILRDNFISYNRIYPSYCPICTVNSDYSDVHEHGGMFAVIVPITGGYDLYLHCYQSERHIKKREKRRIYVGFFSTGPQDWIGKPEHRDLPPLPELPAIEENEEATSRESGDHIVSIITEKERKTIQRNQQHLKDDDPLIKIKADPITDGKLIRKNQRTLETKFKPLGKGTAYLDKMSI